MTRESQPNTEEYPDMTQPILEAPLMASEPDMVIEGMPVHTLPGLLPPWLVKPANVGTMPSVELGADEPLAVDVRARAVTPDGRTVLYGPAPLPGGPRTERSTAREAYTPDINLEEEGK